MKSKKKSFDSFFTFDFGYFFWSAIILGLCLINFSSFVVDLFHILLSIIITVMLLGIFFTRKFVKINCTHSIDQNNIKRYLQNRYLEIYFLKNDKKMLIANINGGSLFSRKRISVCIEKKQIKVNMITLGRFDIPSIFHAIPNCESSNKIAQEIVLENNGC